MPQLPPLTLAGRVGLLIASEVYVGRRLAREPVFAAWVRERQAALRPFGVIAVAVYGKRTQFVGKPPRLVFGNGGFYGLMAVLAILGAETVTGRHMFANMTTRPLYAGVLLDTAAQVGAMATNEALTDMAEIEAFGVAVVERFRRIQVRLR